MILLTLLKGTVDCSFKNSVGLCTGYHSEDLNLRTVWLRQSQKEKGSLVYAGSCSIRKIVLNFCGVFIVVETLLKRLFVQTDCFCTLRQVVHRKSCLVFKKSIMHFPILTLVQCATGGHRRFECVFVSRCYGKVSEHVF